MQKQRLELDWVGKDNEIFLEPRILLQEKVVGTLESQPNQLISGDNLLALKALEQDCAGKIKCVYIDPPYNTGSAFKHYDDGENLHGFVCKWPLLSDWKQERHSCAVPRG